MEPRRITVGDKEYDGISGEIIRHHILENFVRLCQQNKVLLHDRCRGLVPDRGKEPTKQWIESNKSSLPTKEGQGKKLPFLDPDHYPEVTEDLIKNCALCDVGGYLIALELSDNAQGILKRDSCFEVGWLITEHPAVVDFTQHAAYFHTPEKPEVHSLFVQNMRVGIYGGVLRLDLDRIGFNDWWWLRTNTSQYPLLQGDCGQRIRLFLEAIRQWLLSPSFAKQAGWLQHMSGLLEGAIVLSKDGPAPFYSPMKFEVDTNLATGEQTPIIKPNKEYRSILSEVEGKCGNSLEVYSFDSPAEFNESMGTVISKFPYSG
jgi:CRISPR-associated protein Cst2